MNVRKRWVLAATILAVGAAMSLAIACKSSKSITTNTPSTNGTATTSLTPSGTMAATPMSTTGTPQTMMPGAVHIAEKEYNIAGLDGAIMSPSAGSVTFEVHNKGTVEHSFYVFKTDQDPASLTLSGTTVDEAKAGTNEGEISAIPAGGVKTLTANLTAGKYVLLCNLPDHYHQGMHVAFTVQ